MRASSRDTLARLSGPRRRRRSGRGPSLVDALFGSVTKWAACVAFIEPLTCSMPIDVERVNLAALASLLRSGFFNTPPRGYVRGRTTLRDVIAVQLACSDAQAEELVEMMIGRGFLRYDGDPTRAADGNARWIIGEAT